MLFRRVEVEKVYRVRLKAGFWSIDGLKSKIGREE